MHVDQLFRYLTFDYFFKYEIPFNKLSEHLFSFEALRCCAEILKGGP